MYMHFTNYTTPKQHAHHVYVTLYYQQLAGSSSGSSSRATRRTSGLKLRNCRALVLSKHHRPTKCEVRSTSRGRWKRRSQARGWLYSDSYNPATVTGSLEKTCSYDDLYKLGISPNNLEENKNNLKDLRAVEWLEHVCQDAKPGCRTTGDSAHFVLTHLSCSDINWEIMDYLVIGGYPLAAEKFAQETNLPQPADIESIRERVRIRSAIHAGRVDEAIGLINEMDPEVSVPWLS